MSVTDDHLAGLPPAERAALERVRAVIVRAAPEAEEGRSYGMPAVIYEERPLLAFRAAKTHPDDVLVDLIDARKQEITAGR